MLEYISLFIGVIGVLLAIFFYIKSKRTKVLVYSTQSFPLISEKVASIEKFSAQYDGKPLKTLSATNIMLWNYGNAIIQGSDIASLDKLVFGLARGVLILDSQVIKSSKQSNGVKINSNANILYFDFDYIEPKQGFVVRVLHTGESKDFSVHGTVKDGSLKRFHKPRTLELVFHLAAVLIMLSLFLYQVIFNMSIRDVGIWHIFLFIVSLIMIIFPYSRFNGMKVEKGIEVAFKGIDR